MGPPTLHLYVIHTQFLTQRAMRIHGVIQELRTTAISKGYEVRPQLLVKHDPEEVSQRLKDLEPLVCYDPVGDADFDNVRQILGLEMISNIEKHREAWKRISETSSEDPKDIFMVMEDDALLLPGGAGNFGDLLETVAHSHPWDIMFLGISLPTHKESDMLSICTVKETLGGKILPCKESYIIKQQTARRLNDMFAKYRHPLRVQLSYLLHTTPEIRVRHPNKRMILDGSKVGIHPSSIHPNNMLVFNREYVELLQFIHKSSEEINKNLPAIRTLYKQVQHINSPDLMHIFGAILLKAGKHMDAEDILVSAMKQMNQQQGILNNRSDLMKNLINVYQKMQNDLPELLSSTSVYDDPSVAEPDVVPSKGGR